MEGSSPPRERDRGEQEDGGEEQKSGGRHFSHRGTLPLSVTFEGRPVDDFLIPFIVAYNTNVLYRKQMEGRTR